MQVVYFSSRSHFHVTTIASQKVVLFPLPLAKTALIHRFTTTLDIHTASWRLSTPSPCPSITPLGLEMEGFSLRARPPSNCLLFKGGGGGIKALYTSKHIKSQALSLFLHLLVLKVESGKAPEEILVLERKYEHGWCNSMCTMCADCQG